MGAITWVSVGAECLPARSDLGSFIQNRAPAVGT